MNSEYQTPHPDPQLWGCSQKSVRYGKYTTLNMARFLQLIG